MAITLSDAERKLVHDGFLAALHFLQEGREGAMNQAEQIFDLALGGHREALLEAVRSVTAQDDDRYRRS